MTAPHMKQAGENKLMTMEDALRLVTHGASVVIGGTTFSRKPLDLVRGLIRAGIRDLQVYAFLGSLDVDLLVAAGRARSTHCAYVGFEFLGMAPNFRRAAGSGEIDAVEHTEGSIINSLRASAMGIPFLPANASFGSQTVERLQYKYIDCPYTGKKVLACPAIRPRVALIHAWRADRQGNIQAPDALDFLVDTDYMMARAADRVIVSVEEIVPEETVRRNPAQTVLFHYEVDAVVSAPRGAYPTGYPPLYASDWKHIRAYLAACATREGAGQYIKQHVVGNEASG